MSSDYSSEEENNVSESSGKESDDSSLLESVTKEVEQLKPYLYMNLCILRIRKVVITKVAILK